MNRNIIPGGQVAPENHPTTREAADKLQGKAVVAAEAIRGILKAVPDENPEYSLLQSLWFIADGLDDAADAYDRADIAERHKAAGAAA